MLVRHFPSQREKGLQTIGSLQRQMPNHMIPALHLGRALIYLEKFEQGLEVLDKPYPSLQTNKLNEIEPSYLMLMAHTKFGIGRKYDAQILEHLNSLYHAYPFVLNVMDMAQSYMVPDPSKPGESRVDSIH
jgi:hypothetical protein